MIRLKGPYRFAETALIVKPKQRRKLLNCGNATPQIIMSDQKQNAEPHYLEAISQNALKLWSKALEEKAPEYSEGYSHITT